MINLTGQIIGYYQVLEKLGEGGMAAVYKARDQRLERFVAIKVILTSRQESSLFLQRFEREAKTLALLTHPNIVGIIDYGEHGGMPYLVMEYMAGGTLKQRMGQPIPYQQAARILLPIAQALDFAHQHRIVHRDIKPANILLTESGAPMLSDFGIAKLLENPDQVSLTGGMGIGTPEYMSPEQGQGLVVDARADIYSLGLVFYEMVTGRKPFQADTPMAIVLKHMTEPLPRPRLIVPSLPVEVENLLFKALAKSPESRYQSINEMAFAFENLSQKTNIPVAASLSAQPLAPPASPIKPRSGSSTPKKTTTPKWFWVIAGILVTAICLVAATGSGAWWIFHKQATETPPSMPVETQMPQPTVESITGDPIVANIDQVRTILEQPEDEWPTMLYTIATQQTSSSENSIYLVNLNTSQPILWNWGWCARDRETLDENLSHIQFAFFINDQQIPEDSMPGLYASQEQYECYYLYTLIEQWPAGPHTLVVKTKIDDLINDGYQDFPASIEINTYNVYVGD